MRTPALAFFAALTLIAGAPAAMAQAHGHGAHAASAVQTTPADGAMGAAPASFSATFAHPMRLTSLVITPRGGDPIAVPVAAGEAAEAVTAPLPALAPGNYTITWTATSPDNHVMNGVVRYMVH